MCKGSVVSIHLARSASVPMESAQEANAIAGQGLEGDRYAVGIGQWSKIPGAGREITLIEIESIEALAREKSVSISPGAARRNVVTQGVALNDLVGREFQVGAVRLCGVRLCDPCAYLETLTQPGVLAGLIHRGGLRADVVQGGTIRVNDAIAE